MANSYKDIIITPNRANTADPKIEFRGGNTSVNTAITMQTYPTSNGTLSFEGSAGQLLSITNDLTGSIFSVNDVSGIPSIEVFANGQINMAQYGGNVVIGSNAVSFGNGVYVAANSNVGIGTATPPSKLAIVTSSSAGSTLGSWSNSHVAIGPAVGSASGSGIGFGYNTSTDQAEIVAIAPGVVWRPLSIFSSGINFNSISGGVAVSITSSGQLGAAIDIRSPIYYDGNNTAYYADPDSTSQFNTIEAKNGSGFRTFINGSASVASQIYFGNAGNTRAWNWQLDENNDGALWSYNGTAWAKRFTVTQTGSVISSVDMRAPIFYDSNNTTYYVDPEIGTNLRGSIVLHDSGGASPLLDIRAATSSPWALRLYRSDLGGGAQMYARSASEWYHSAILTAAASMRSPIFYDEDNTAYYTDPADTSRFVRLILNNGDNLSWGAAYGAGVPTIAATTNTALYFYPTGSTAGTTFTMYGTYAIATGSMRSPLFYDSDNTTYLIDPAGTSILVNMSLGGGQTVNGQSHFQWEGATYRNPGDHTPGLLIRADNATAGINGSRPALSLYNENGGDQTTVAMAFVSREQSGAGNAVNLAGIVAKKEIAGTSGAWTDGSLTLYTRQGGTRRDALYIDPAGFILAPGSIRSTVFYDSENTSYFIDPAGTSNINAIDIVGQLRAGYSLTRPASLNGSNYAARIGGNDVFCVINSLDGTASYAVGIQSMRTSDSVSFPLLLNPNGSNVTVGQNSDLNYKLGVNGIIFTNTSSRAPLFYDSDDTAYNLDPASTSRLNQINYTSMYNAADGNYGIVGNNGFFDTLNSGSAGDQLELCYSRGTFTSTSGSMRAPLFYDRDDTVYYTDPASVSNISSMLTQAAISNNVNGLRNINPGGGSWVTNSSSVPGAIKIKLPETVYPMMRFTVRVYTYDGLSFDIYCGGHTSTALWYNTFAYMTTQNRSPLNVRFTYDGTNMYVMIGELGQTWAYPQVFITDVQVGYTNYEYSRWDDGWVISFEESTYHTVAITHLVSPPTSSSNNTSDAYAAIYYDSNNTAYRANPNGNSVFSSFNIGNNEVYFYESATNAASIRTGSSAAYKYFTFNAIGDFYALNGNIVAPRFYDLDNTAYYVDSNNTSVMWETKSYYFTNIAAVSDNHPFGLYFGGDRSTSYAIYREPGAWDTPFPDLRIAFHTGIKIGANAGYQGVRFYTDYDMGTQVMSVNNGSDALGAGNVYVNNSLVAGSSLRAPIFYDQDNTGYFVDPAAATSLRTVGDWRSNSGDWTGEFGGKIQYHANNWYFQSANEWIFRRSDAATAFRVEQSGFGTFLASIRVGSGATSSDIYMGDSDNGERRLHCNSDRIGFLTQAEGWGSYCSDNGDWTTETISYALASSRSPIFYDYNNTAYLFDGDGTSRWNISSQDSNHVFNQCGVGIVGSYDSTKFQTVFAMGSSYNSNAAGTSLSGAYGLWWSYPSAGGPAANLSTHGLLCVVNGSTYAQLDASTRAVTDMRAPIFYDLNNSGYYCNPDGTSNFLDMYVQGGFGGTSNNAAYTYAAIEVRERGFGGAQDDTWATAPRVAFHWGGRVASQIGISSSARITVLNGAGDAVEAFECGNFYSPIFYDYNDTAYSVDPTGTSRTGLIRADYYGRAAHNTGFLRGGYNNIGASEGQTSPIYCIGSSYEPAATTLGSMYGIGFTSGGSFFPSGASGWGMYTADNGVSRIFLSAASGDITATGNITAYASDRRLKTNIKPISNAIDKLMRINGVEFDWVDNIQEIGFIPQTMHETGVIAQEIQAVIPDAVKIAPFNKNATDISGIDNEYLTVDKEKIIPLLIEAIKEQQARINRLEETVNNLMGNK